MKILLLNPLSASAEMNHSDLGLGYLAASLRQNGHQVTISVHLKHKNHLLKTLHDLEPDVIGIKVFSANVPETIRTIALIRPISKACLIIGGPHVSGDAASVLNYIHADYGFLGESDLALPYFVNSLQDGSFPKKRKEIPGLIYREEGEVQVNPPALIEDLDALPIPAWDLIPPGKHASLVCKKWPAAGILASRGCSNHCYFCCESHKKLRFRSPEKISSEIKLLKEKFGVKEIQFLDSNFLANKRLVTELCELILRSDLALAYCAPNGIRLDVVDEKICALMAQAGFYRVATGIESGSQRILNEINKELDLSTIANRISCLRKFKIQVIGNFMLGLPGETRDDILKTLKLALSLDLTAVNFSIYVPMPGTVLYDKLTEQGKLPHNMIFSEYDYFSYANSLSELSSKELTSLRNKGLLHFYLRPQTISSLLEILAGGISLKSLLMRSYWMYWHKLIRPRSPR